MTDMVIMHGDHEIATVNRNGSCIIRDSARLPYDLFLEKTTDDIDIMIQNLNNFYHWCATRLINIDRAYIKEILNSIGASQLTTDRDRAEIAMSYHALSLIDLYWVRETGEDISFADINLYDHSLTNAFTDLSLRGKQMTVENRHLIANNLNTPGMFPKAWIRRGDTFYLLKDGNEEAVDRELIASRIAGCFDVPQVRYTEDCFEDTKVTRSEIFTSKKYSIATMEAFQIYSVNHEINWLEDVLKKDAHGFYTMNIIDYLVGNTDRHWGNWGWLIDNESGERIRLHDLMDFNQAFRSYDTTDGAMCQPLRTINQREAALDAISHIGFHPIGEFDDAWFAGHDEWRQMFHRRLEICSATAP
ncbi:MAG: hypothetical protein J5819_00840 [Eubacterium sp.]|nr:hypothetical protein [Eubacterium sp.]